MFLIFLEKKYVEHPKIIIAINECPEGKEYPVSARN